MKLLANIIVMVCVVVTLLVALLLVPRVFGADPSSIGALPATASAVSSGGLMAEPRPSEPDSAAFLLALIGIGPW